VALLWTCEHASRRVPRALAAAFAGHAALVRSHRGVDIGAWVLARQLAAAHGGPLMAGAYSRLVVDLNRKVGHPARFSEVMHMLPEAVRQRAHDTIYVPHRQAVQAHVVQRVRRGTQVVHVGVHSFTPVWHGVRRPIDVGLLFDPARPEEAALCRHWQRVLQARCPDWRVRRNAPYRGTADGLTTDLRRLAPSALYMGIELEMNQAMAALAPRQFAQCRQHIVDAFGEAWAAFKSHHATGRRHISRAAVHKKF
jgi:predicted N-formylglutamate amidohydrolase